MNKLRYPSKIFRGAHGPPAAPKYEKAGRGVLCLGSTGCQPVGFGGSPKRTLSIAANLVRFSMRFTPLILAILSCTSSTFAGDIREFDLKTIERLGNELTRVSQTPDRGATSPVRKRAQQTAKAALQGKLFNIRYDYVVLDDPERTGFLVYALGSTTKRDEVVFCGHFRVTVSADGEKAQRIDALSKSLVIDKVGEGLPKG
ncbi:MAG: hypothetical protein QOH39_1267 [Verrucomicrobiota bacterium]